MSSAATVPNLRRGSGRDRGGPAREPEGPPRHIVRMRPHVIKLDVSMVRNIDRDKVASSMARALSSFGREMEASIAGEGVETLAEMATLRTLGISG